MADTQQPSDETGLYRFSVSGGAEIETRRLDSDDAAEEYARQLPVAKEQPVLIERHDHVDWEYVTEVDERS
ncbi:MAG TPA: hypothetical protein VL984_07625 [Acidimicrobiales bacterium]|nr:hypothetical protein [Acidimicrobiales bacterium]